MQVGMQREEGRFVDRYQGFRQTNTIISYYVDIINSIRDFLSTFRSFSVCSFTDIVCLISDFMIL
jgi:hypothetical protein